MSTKAKLRSALSAIDDAKRALKRAQQGVTEDYEIRRAIRELDDAESQIERALRELG